MYYRKLNLLPETSANFLGFVSKLNERILEICKHSDAVKPSYWYITEIMKGYFYGYDDNGSQIDKNIEIEKWSDLNLHELSLLNVFNKFKLLNIVFCLYKHNFPVHRHAEWLPGDDEYFRHALVVSKTSGVLKLCQTSKGKFEIKDGDITQIDHLGSEDNYIVEKEIKISFNDIFVFDSTTWHTFESSMPISKEFFTTTFILNNRTQDGVDLVCDRLETI